MTNRTQTEENRLRTMRFVDAQDTSTRLLIYEYGVAAYIRARDKGGDLVANLKAEREARQAGTLDKDTT
jgi:hypothetical protein